MGVDTNKYFIVFEELHRNFLPYFYLSNIKNYSEDKVSP